MNAQHSLGLFYLKGRDVERNDEEAVKHFRMAAEQGSPEAQTSLDYYYAEGRGVAIDYGEAMKYLLNVQLPVQLISIGFIGSCTEGIICPAKFFQLCHQRAKFCFTFCFAFLSYFFFPEFSGFLFIQ